MAVRQRDMHIGRTQRRAEPVYWDETPPRPSPLLQLAPRRSAPPVAGQGAVRGSRQTAIQRMLPQPVVEQDEQHWFGRGHLDELEVLEDSETALIRPHDHLWERLRREDVQTRQPVRQTIDGVGRRLSAACTLIVIGLTVWLLISLVQDVAAWGQVKLDDLRYGYPRTYQADGYLGYGERPGTPSHLVAMNLHGQVVLTIFDGGDPRHAFVIRGPHLLGINPDEHPVTASLVDVNGDGYADVVAHVAGQTLIYLSVPQHHSFVVAPTAIDARYTAVASASSPSQ